MRKHGLTNSEENSSDHQGPCLQGEEGCGKNSDPVFIWRRLFLFTRLAPKAVAFLQDERLSLNVATEKIYCHVAELLCFLEEPRAWFDADYFTLGCVFSETTREKRDMLCFDDWLRPEFAQIIQRRKTDLQFCEQLTYHTGMMIE
ncbi:hypothetical protein CEXT_343071 [Caerostris extrusa]|uniref:Uncharacterized protein n=1 Tax=Caerostris extrusa TaxID=172846 RepID=A0AAV4SBX1_CAEEX|nr:hypothetical protein CEXT_343071 [Caerostris extrusa]